MTVWVHRATDGKPWYESARYEPPLPPVVAGRGYAVFFVELDGFTFRFASLRELEVCADMLGQKVLPTAIRLSREHGTGSGPNSHWLARLPAKVKPWKYREKAVRYLREARERFIREIRSES